MHALSRHVTDPYRLEDRRVRFVKLEIDEEAGTQLQLTLRNYTARQQDLMAASPMFVRAPYLYLIKEIGDFIEHGWWRGPQERPRALPGERLSHSLLAVSVPDRSSYATLPFFIIETFDGKQIHKNFARSGVG